MREIHQNLNHPPHRRKKARPRLPKMSMWEMERAAPPHTTQLSYAGQNIVNNNFEKR